MQQDPTAPVIAFARKANLLHCPGRVMHSKIKNQNKIRFTEFVNLIEQDRFARHHIAMAS